MDFRLPLPPAILSTYDVVLSGGRVMAPASGIDSSLNIGITGDRIVAMSAEPLSGKTVVDASGLVVTPGFIDLHAHGQTPDDNRIQARDGVTTARDMEGGIFPVATWYAKVDGTMPLNYGAAVAHRAARYNVFHGGVEIGHAPTNPAAILALGPGPAGANQQASGVQIAALESSVSTPLIVVLCRPRWRRRRLAGRS